MRTVTLGRLGTIGVAVAVTVGAGGIALAGHALATPPSSRTVVAGEDRGGRPWTGCDGEQGHSSSSSSAVLDSVRRSSKGDDGCGDGRDHEGDCTPATVPSSTTTSVEVVVLGNRRSARSSQSTSSTTGEGERSGSPSGHTTTGRGERTTTKGDKEHQKGGEEDSCGTPTVPVTTSTSSTSTEPSSTSSSSTSSTSSSSTSSCSSSSSSSSTAPLPEPSSSTSTTPAPSPTPCSTDAAATGDDCSVVTKPPAFTG